MEGQAERTGVLVVRIWIEGENNGLRARLTGTQDITRGEETTFTAGTADEVVEIVRAWVEAFATAS
jgi:hypothetical protein